MLRRQRIKPDDKIPFPLSGRERDLLLDLTLVDPDIELRLRAAATSGAQLVVGLTLEDADDLADSVAAEANHTETAKKRRGLEKLFDRLTAMDGEYTDADVETTPTLSSSAAPKPSFTAKQGQYLAFIYYYTKLHHGVAPAEADFLKYFRTSPPAVHQMILTLEKRELIERTPGAARSIRLRLSRSDLPDLE